jgi:hypothetical protein
MPRKISNLLGIESKRLQKMGAFDSFTDVDSRLHIDPSLLANCPIPEFRNSRKAFEDYFKKILIILSKTKQEGDVFWKEAFKRLQFKENTYISLGYSKNGTSGNAIGKGLASEILETASEILNAGIDDPLFFELIGLFQDGIGADRLSDMTVSILYKNFAAYTERIAKELNVKHVKSYTIQQEKFILPYDSTFHIESEKFEQLKNEIRDGLITSINKIHPKHDIINQDEIKLIASQFKDFTNIYTTNYDLFLYYIILETKTRGDHFFNHHNSNFNYFNAPDSYNYAYHIYYLHGALFLFETGLRTLKIKKPNSMLPKWLLGTITEEISKNNYPLFISEGKSETKLKAIQSNSYLSFCLNKFGQANSQNLVVYGQSLSEQDNHLVKIIDKNYKKVAISIKTDNNQSLKQIIAKKNRISSVFSEIDYEFYDAASLFNFIPNPIKN